MVSYGHETVFRRLKRVGYPAPLVSWVKERQPSGGREVVGWAETEKEGARLVQNLRVKCIAIQNIFTYYNT